MTHPYYFHAPGDQSRWGVVDVGLKCTHSCAWCYYSFLDSTDDQFAGMRHAKFHTKENLFAVIDGLADNGFLGFDVTGGEPTLHPDIVEIISHATKRGLSSRIITLGQWLMRPMKNTEGRNLVDALLDAGVTNFLLSTHAVDERLFEKITGESFAKLHAAHRYFQERGFHYTTNTTVSEHNYRHLPDIARYIAGSGSYMHNFIVMNAYYEWGRKGRTDGVQAHYGQVSPHLREAVAILEDSSIAVNVRYAPMCSVAGLEKNLVGIVGVRYDPYEWMNQIDHKADPETLTNDQAYAMGRRIEFPQGQPSPGADLFGVEGHAKGTKVIAARGVPPQGVAKLFPENCQKCSAIESCDGVDPRYLGERGPQEFVPYVHADASGVLHKERLSYLPAFFVKRKPEADMKALMRRMFKPPPVGENPKVSVVITCFNYGKYLGKCLESVKAQTWKNTEVILVNDGSTDSTVAVWKEHGAGVSYLYQPNSGQPAYPRNKGIEHSIGDLVMCLDADDWIALSYIEECVRQFQKHQQAWIVWTGTQCWQEDGTTQADMFAAAPYDFSALRHACTVVCSAMFRREVWEATGGYRANIRGSEDWDHWINAGGLGYFGVPVSRQLFNYRRHPDGIFETDVVPNYAQKVRQVILNNSDLYPPHEVASARHDKIGVRHSA